LEIATPPKNHRRLATTSFNKFCPVEKRTEEYRQMSKKTKKDKKPRPQPKPNRQIPNSMLRAMKLLGPRHYLQHAREYPILGCWIMEG
jgi:hypothetical protein